MLDVGCGTGYFTRSFARDAGLRLTGLDPDPAGIAWARAHGGGEAYVLGDARQLPFADASFDHVLSVTALCFIQDQPRVLCEIARVARRSFALGLLNRRSMLYGEKGRHGGTGAYRCAHWHTVGEATELLSALDVERARTGIFLPSAGTAARLIERLAPNLIPWGAFIAVAGVVRLR